MFVTACQVGPVKSLISLLRKFPLQQSLRSATFVKMTHWQVQKEKILSLPSEERRKLYRAKQYIQLSDIPTWEDFSRKESISKQIPIKTGVEINSSLNSILCQKISIFRGDITSLEIDAIVNAANKTLMGGGGVDGAIHRAAGPVLVEECKSLHGCETGEAKITGGYNLPSKYVIHTVGPRGEKPELLQRCYRNSLKLMLEYNLRTIAFPCISTGIYGYPPEPAAHIAAYEVRKHLESNADKVDRVIFCIFMPEDLTIYTGILQSYFPLK